MNASGNKKLILDYILSLKRYKTLHIGMQIEVTLTLSSLHSFCATVFSEMHYNVVSQNQGDTDGLAFSNQRISHSLFIL